MEQRDGGQTLTAAVLGVALALAGPYALAGAEAGWERIVMLSLLLACAFVLVAAFVLAAVARICDGRGGSAGDRLHLLADAFLIATVGMFLVTAVFAFVLAVIGIS